MHSTHTRETVSSVDNNNTPSRLVSASPLEVCNNMAPRASHSISWSCHGCRGESGVAAKMPTAHQQQVSETKFSRERFSQSPQRLFVSHKSLQLFSTASTKKMLQTMKANMRRSTEKKRPSSVMFGETEVRVIDERAERYLRRQRQKRSDDEEKKQDEQLLAFWHLES